MKKYLFILICFFCGSTFSQNLEEAIYTATEAFISNKNEASLKRLNQQEQSFKTHIKTKDEHLALVFLQCHKGCFLDEHSKLKEAISTYEDALNRFNNHELSKISDFDMVESCLKPLGNLYTKTGDFTNAVSTISQYIFLAEKSKNTNHQISGAINLAKLYQTIGKHETVLKIVNDALKLSNINGTQKTKLQSIKASSLLVLNKLEVTSPISNTATLSTFETHKNSYEQALQKGDYLEALNAFNKAKKQLPEANISARYLAKFYVEEAQLYHVLKQPNKALQSLQQAIKILLPNFSKKGLPSKEELYPENTFIAVFDLYAAIQNTPEKALESYNLSFYVSGLLQENWTSQEAKIFNETANRMRSEHCIDILFNTYIQTKNEALLFEAFQYSENSKASVLKAMSLKKMRLQQFPNDSLLIKEFRLLKAQEYATGLLIKEQLGTNKAFEINRLSQELSAISLKLKTLKTAISKKYSESNKGYTLKTIQEKLAKNGAVLVTYFFGKNTLYQFIISEKSIVLERISLTEETKKDIVHFIHLFDDALVINTNIAHYTQQGFHVFQLLKFNKLLKYKKVVIVPDGLLNFLPFEALLTSKTTTTTFAEMPFVVKNQHISYNSSTAFYLNENQKKKNNNLLGFFPVFENTNQKLTYSIQEANTIKREMPSKMFMNSEATKINFLENASKYSILHVSTHASSGDFINPANLTFYDDTLILNELYSLNLNANLVVLSACETGIGKLYKGEGAMSIARGFQYAGADNLLFSLWQINDLSTSQIMQLFYENYNTTQSAYLANRQSKLAYLENETISNVKKSPYYWSAFVYYGALEPEKTNNTLFYIIFGMLALVIIVFLFFKFKKA